MGFPLLVCTDGCGHRIEGFKNFRVDDNAPILAKASLFCDLAITITLLAIGILGAFKILGFLPLPISICLIAIGLAMLIGYIVTVTKVAQAENRSVRAKPLGQFKAFHE